MITIPLWPFVIAIAVVYALIFTTFMLYEEGFKYSLFGTFITFVISFAIYMSVYGLEACF